LQKSYFELFVSEREHKHLFKTRRFTTIKEFEFMEVPTLSRRRDIYVGIATDYGVDGRGSIAGWGQDFSFLHSVQNGPGAHSAAHPIGSGG
jgi:hypothetical protein